MHISPFVEPQLERMAAVGRVGARSFRLWLRSPGGGAHVLSIWPSGSRARAVETRFVLEPRPETDWTYAFEVPRGLGPDVRLEPDERYELEVAREDGTPVGSAAFWTAPEAHAGRIVFALSSCHQPFDEAGAVQPQAPPMLEAARHALLNSEARFLLQAGDQCYSDHPPGQSLFSPGVMPRFSPDGKESLFDCTREEVRRAYHARYRWFWGLPGYQRLVATCASWPMLDDHELADNWGSRPEHASPRFRPIFEGARAAYADYQHSRIAERGPFDEAPFHFSFDFGPLSVFALDVRTERRAGGEGKGRILGVQFDALAGWLQAHRSRPALVLLVPLPVLFMPEWLARGAASGTVPKITGDALDRWSHPQFIDERTRLLELLHAHQRAAPSQRLLLCAGDVHVGYAMTCVWKDEPDLFFTELVSSALSHQMGRADSALATWIPRLETHQHVHGERLRLKLVRGGRRFPSPVRALNVGLVELSLEHGRARLGLRLIGDDPRAPGTPRVLLDTGWL